MKALEMAKSGLTLVAAELMIVLSVSVISPLVGAFVLAPLAALSIGTVSGWCCATRFSNGHPSELKAARAGAVAGLGALAGSFMAAMRIGGVEASPTTMMVLGLFSLGLSSFGGLMAALAASTESNSGLERVHQGGRPQPSGTPLATSGVAADPEVAGRQSY